MAEIRELQKRLKSVQAIGQLSSAMRTVATAKFSRLSAMNAAYRKYADRCDRILTGLCPPEFRKTLGGAVPAEQNESPEENEAKSAPVVASQRPKLIVLFGTNRGLCGGYNHDLLGFFDGVAAQEPIPPRVLVLGRVAVDYVKRHGLAFETLAIPDVPELLHAETILERIRALYEGGEISGAVAVYQHFVNTLKQVPQTKYLPMQTKASLSDQPNEKGKLRALFFDEEEDSLYLPDRTTVQERLYLSCFEADLYAILLESALGAQSATLVAMRSASENAEKSAAALTTMIHRCRQAEVTASVLETASDSFISG